MSQSRDLTRLLALFVSVYLAAMLVLLPARWLHQQVSSLLPEVGSVQGTLWQGAAEEIKLPLSVKRLEWSWSPLAALNGRLGYQLALGEQAIARLQWGYGQQFYLQDMVLQGRLSDWFVSFHGAPLPVDVSVSGQIPRAQGGPQGCVSIDDAEVQLQRWQGLMAATLNRLGTVAVKLGCDEGAVRARLRSDAGLQGQWVLQPDGQYSLQLQIADTDAELAEQLKLLGFRGAGRGLQLRRQGRL